MSLATIVDEIWIKHKTVFEKRLSTWIKSFEDNEEALALMKKQFHQWSNLRVYVSTTKAKSRIFSLRFFGQEVAQLIPRGNKILIRLSGHGEKNKGLFAGFTFEDGEYDWHSDQGKAFRAYFKKLSRKSFQIRIPEHRVESKFIAEMQRGTGKFGIHSLKIKPVTIGGIPLQIPLPISASRNKPKPGKGYIDILSRHKGVDNKDRMCLWELKKPDTYAHPAAQVYVYAATLIKMLRNTKDGPRWYRLFGFRRKLPNKLEIEAVVAISPSQKEKFKDEVAKLKADSSFEIGNDRICMYAAYYVEQPESARILFESDPFADK